MAEMAPAIAIKCDFRARVRKSSTRRAKVRLSQRSARQRFVRNADVARAGHVTESSDGARDGLDDGLDNTFNRSGVVSVWVYSVNT